MESISLETGKLKYKIKLKLAGLTEPSRMKVKSKIRKKWKVSDSTYSRYINARENETTDIPGKILEHFADIFLCKVDDLYNNDKA